MNYPGNPSLSKEVRERLFNTFQQTLQLAEKGSRQEAKLGCDFILRLDPSFEPAEALRQRLEDGEGPLVVADLRAPAEDPGDATNPDVFGGLVEAEDLPELPGAPAAGERGDALEAALADLLEKRDLRRLVQVAEDRRNEVAGNAGLRKIVETAYSLLEAEPYVESFLASARAALAAGDQAETHRLVEKARSLDPSHPGIAELSTALRGGAAAGAPAGAEPVFGGDAGDLEAGAGGGGPRFTEDAFSVDSGLVLESDQLFATEPLPDAAEIPATDPLLVGAGEETPTAVDPGLVLPGEDIFAAVGGPEAGAMAPPQPGDRVQELLGDGQAVFERGDYQGAIDVWSRIFLINIDHPEASRRIEEARRLKEESERQIEEILHDAAAAVDSGDPDGAREMLQDVLAFAPDHPAARDLLERIERGEALPSRPAAATPTPPPAATPATPWEPTVSLSPAAGAILQEEILVPPDPTDARPARPAPAAPAREAPSRGRNFVYIGGAVLVLVVLVGVFAWQQWDRLFPNATPPADRPARATDPIDRATQLHDSGQVERAVGMLSRLPADHPRHGEAQELVARWEGELSAAAPAAPGEEAERQGPTERQLELRDQILDAARQAYAGGEILLADQYFQRAQEIAPLGGTAAELYRDTQIQLVPLRQEIDLFEQREWEFVLPRLWALHQDEPGNRDVVRLIVDSYYNLAVRDLQRGDAVQATDRLKEALALRPDSEDLQRQHLFAQTYRSRPKDLLYTIYVKYLPFR